jgi:hypothetical protein
MTRDELDTTLEVERFLMGELSEARVQKLRAKLGDARLSQLREQHARESDQLFAALPPAQFRQQVEARARQLPLRSARGPGEGAAKRGPPPLTWALLPAAAALVFFVARETPHMPSTTPDTVEQTLPKGLAPSLVVFRKQASTIHELAPGARVRERDLLQLGYVAAGKRFGMILSLDGAGAVTVHEPGPKLEPAGRHMLDRAYVLDAAPGFERFFLVTSDQAFDSARVLDAVERIASAKNADTAPLELPPGLSQASFLVRKEGP